MANINNNSQPIAIDKLKTPSGLSLIYKNSECIELFKKITNFDEEIDSVLKLKMNNCVNSYDSLFKELQTKLSQEKYSKDYFINYFKEMGITIHSLYEEIILNMELIMKNVETEDLKVSDTSKKDFNKYIVNTSTDYTKNNSINREYVDKIEILDIEQQLSTIGAIVGNVTFQKIVPLYEMLESNVIIDSDLKGNYGLLSIVLKDGEYYYQIYNKDTSQVFYTLMDDSIKIEPNDNSFLVASENTAMLISPSNSIDNAIKQADQDTMYLIQEEIQVDDNTYYSVLDTEDYQIYYVLKNENTTTTTIDNLSMGDL